MQFGKMPFRRLSLSLLTLIRIQNTIQQKNIKQIPSEKIVVKHFATLQNAM